jgi:hypothetical protein
VAESIPAADSLEATLDECADLAFSQAIVVIMERQADELRDANSHWIYECNPDGSIRTIEGSKVLTWAGNMFILIGQNESPAPMMSMRERFRRVRAKVAGILGHAAVGLPEPLSKGVIDHGGL